MQDVIIIGSEGFIGNHLVRHFLNKGQVVYGCGLSEIAQQPKYKYFQLSRTAPDWENVFTKHKFEYCINAAGSGNVPYSIEHPVMDFEANTATTIRILDIIRKTQQQCNYLHISSAAVYGNPSYLPVQEDLALHPLSPYGWHKLMSEMLCREYHELYGVKTVIVRPFSVYGNGLKKQLLWDICQKMQDQQTVTLFGTGKESRDFIHVTDLVQLLERIMQHSEFNCNIYNAASGIETTIHSIAEIFEQYFDNKKKIGFSGKARAGDPVNWCADIQKARSLGFQPVVDLEQGIRSYIEWHLQLQHA
jgi:dTDP-glucose 4,6-dehydratase/UDP-glucose 4-epimerase